MGYDIDPTIPGDDDIISQHPAAARTFRQTVQDLLSDDHDEGASGSGKHNKVTLKEQSSDPVTLADELAIYTKDDGGSPSLYVRDESAGTVTKLFDGTYFYGLLYLLAGAPATNRKMLADLILANTIAVTGEKAAGGAYYDLLQLDGSDQLLIGESTADKIQKVIFALASNVSDPEQQLLFNYGAGNKKIFHEGYMTGIDADYVGGVEAADVMSFDSSVYAEDLNNAVPAGGYVTLTHGFGSVPRLTQAVLRCTTNDEGYVVGDEIEITGAIPFRSTADQPIATAWRNSTYYGVSFQDENFYVVKKDGSGKTSNLTKSSWVIDLRAWK